jgi:hypothetical protein
MLLLNCEIETACIKLKFIEANVIKYLGSIEDEYEEKLIKYLDYFNQNIYELKNMSKNCETFINLKNNKIKYILND